MKNRISTFIVITAVLLFGSTTAIAQQTKINFKKNDTIVYQTAISEISSIILERVDEVYFVDISEETDCDLMIAAIDGSMVFLNMDTNTGIPTQLFYKDKNGEDGFSVFFKENGLPEMMVIDGNIIYFGNFRDSLFDCALIHPDSSIEYFYDIEAQMDWDGLDSLFDISKSHKGIGSFFKKVTQVVVKNVLGAVSCGLNTAAAIGTGGLAIVGAVTSCGSLVVNVLNDIVPNTPIISDIAGFINNPAITGTSAIIGCQNVLIGNTIDVIDCIVGFADFAIGVIENGIETTNSKASSIAYANVHINGGILYIDTNGTAQVVPSNVPVLVYAGHTSLGTAGTTTWVCVNGTQVAGGRITVSGDVRIILSDSCHLNASNGGINVPSGSSLTIYSQSMGNNMGELTAIGANGNNGGNASSGGKGGDAGIGGNGGIGGNNNTIHVGNSGGNAGTITINGGIITAQGGNAGNGGNSGGAGGGGAGAGIGGGGAGGGDGTIGIGDNGNDGGAGGIGATLIINRGTVTAIAGSNGTGGSGKNGTILNPGAFGGAGGGGKSAGIGGGGGGGAGGSYGATGVGNSGSNGSNNNGYDGGKGGDGGNIGSPGAGQTSRGIGGAGGTGGTYSKNGGSVILQ